MSNTNTTNTEVAPVQVGNKKNKFLVVSKSGTKHTRSSFRNYSFACVHVFNSKDNYYEDGGEYASWHSNIKNAKPNNRILPWIKEWYVLEVKP
jgi:hypothetical protein